MSTTKHDPEYIKWVQYSLNRLISAWIYTDGAVSDYYRTCVKAFQTKRLPVTGQVGPDTQDLLIRINNFNESFATKTYLKWVQTALNESTGYDGDINGFMTKETKKAIQNFQLKHKHKHIDGVVGSKTERDLIKAVPSLMIPGWYMGGSKKEDDPIIDTGDDWHKNKNDWNTLDVMIRAWTDNLSREFEETGTVWLEGIKNHVIKRMLPKLQDRQIWGYSPRTKYDFLPANRVNKFDVYTSLSSVMFNGLHQIRNEVTLFPISSTPAYRYKLFKNAVEQLYEDIDYGIFEIFKLKTLSSGTQAGAFAILENWYDKQYADKSSLISCFPPPPDSEIFPGAPYKTDWRNG